MALLVFITIGCSDDFLELNPQDQITQANFPESPEDALLATNAMYQVLRDARYHRGFFPIDDIMSDDALKGSNPGDALATVGPFETFEFNTSNEFLQNWWQTLYLGIRRTNVVLDRVPPIDIEESLKNRYLGEARFLRALFYSDLARGYGGVPLILTGTTDGTIQRASLEDTYTAIESDLRRAINLLPEKSDYRSDDLGRATRGAARALLSRVYLYQQQWDSAVFFAEEVINSGQYSLEPVYENAFDENFEHGIESVFEIGGIGVQGDINAGQNGYTAAQGVRGTPNRGFGFNRPSLDLINSFEANDPRMEATVIFLGETLDGIFIEGDPLTADVDDTGQPETYNQKVWTPGETVFSNREHNRRIIRYAEVLLNAAEAYAENENAVQALSYLEQVRARAREGNATILPEITETNPDALLDLIFEERRHELAMEGFRFWDLVRSGRAPAVLGPLGFQTDKHELLPIPQLERDITNNNLVQNQGWE
ncbi:MAG: RagB/SusD family nutrient uptake outer membrane protein [Bacteroidota bacterium]